MQTNIDSLLLKLLIANINKTLETWNIIIYLAPTIYRNVCVNTESKNMKYPGLYFTERLDVTICTPQTVCVVHAHQPVPVISYHVSSDNNHWIFPEVQIKRGMRLFFPHNISLITKLIPMMWVTELILLSYCTHIIGFI